MIGILSAGIIADRAQRRGISPVSVMLGCHAVYFVAQAIIVFEYMPLAVVAWLATAATGQVAILAYPWLSQHVGNELAGRSNAAINFSVFLVAFATQYGVGLIIGLFPATATGYEPSAYRWAFGIFLILQLAALAWYCARAQEGTRMTHPILVEVTRGGMVESQHSGSYVVVDGKGRVVASAGDIEMPVFPRSAIKALQCLPVIESGAADHYGFSDEEIALICSSHNGEPRHVAAARSMLAKAGLDEEAYECGAHWPIETQALHAMIRADEKPGQVHNNCSGKHAGMLAVAQRIGTDHHGYVERGHAVQRGDRQSVERDVRCRCRHVALRHRRLLGADLGDPVAQSGARLCAAWIGRGLES